MYSLPLLFTGLALTSAVNGLNTFMGCRDTSQTSNFITGSSANAPDGAGCETYCATEYPSQSFAFTYSAYSPAKNPNCYCSTTSLAGSGTSASVSIQDPKTCARFFLAGTTYSVSRIQTAYDLDGCFTAITSTGTTATRIGSTDCFARCPTSTRVGIYHYGGSDTGRVDCFCDVTSATGPVTCDQQTYFVHSRTAAAAGSGFAKRDARAASRRAAQLSLQNKLCPASYLPCVVPGTNSYECIDPSSELESCGGCVHGVFDNANSTSTGTDCSLLAGAPLGAYTCASGSCQAAVCSEGHELDASGMCV